MKSLRPTLIKLHRWLSLAMLALWLLQALSGMLMVFHWELDDATIAAPDRPLNLEKIAQSLAQLAPAGSGKSISSIWTSAGGHDRWDVSLPGASIRMDGEGHILRTRHDGELLRDGGLLDTIDNLHQSLMAGDTGGWIIGLSGGLLLSNLVLGLIAAWPRRNQWRRALIPNTGHTRAARLYGWHRALGLWFALPAMLLVITGTLSVFSDGVQSLIHGAPPAAPATKATFHQIDLPTAVRIALARQPQARLAAIIFPDPGSATWQIRLVEPGEPARAYGQSRIFIDGNAGRIIGEFDAPHATAAQRLAEVIYPLHTGEALGTIGRLAVLLLGAWLATMIVLGATLWWTRRTLRKRKPA